MVQRLRLFVAFVVVALMVQPVLAADGAKPAKKGEKKPAAAKKAPSVVQIPKGLELTSEQQAVVAQLNEKFGPRMTELRGRMAKIVSPEQNKARAEAMKKAREEGKKGKDLQAAADAAAPVTEAQKAELETVKKEMQTVQQEIKTALLSVLTEEQKAKLAPQKGEKKPAAKTEKKPGEKKPAAKKPAAE